MLLVYRGRDQVAVWPGDRAAALPVYREGVKFGGDDNLVVQPPYLSRNIFQIHLFLPGLVGNADSAAQVHEVNPHPGLFFPLRRKLKDDSGRVGKEVRVQLVGGDHRVQTKALHALLGAAGVGFNHLLAGQAVLGFLRLADYRIAARLEGAGVVAEADCLGQPAAQRLFEEVYVRDVVQVDYVSLLVGIAELLCRGVVAREHDVFAADSNLVAEDKLGQAGAVAAAAFGL